MTRMNEKLTNLRAEPFLLIHHHGTSGTTNVGHPGTTGTGRGTARRHKQISVLHYIEKKRSGPQRTVHLKCNHAKMNVFWGVFK